MRKTLLAGLVALAGLWFVAVSLRGQRTPAHAATAAVPALGLTVTAELFPLSDLTEFERHLTLSADGGATLRVRMANIQGPADRTGLYRVGGEAEIALLGPAGGTDGGLFFAVGPLRRLERPSRPPTDWTCLGAFELSFVPNGRDPARGRTQALAFVPAAPEEERVSAAGDEAGGRPGGDRAGRACPTPRPMAGAPGKAPG